MGSLMRRVFFTVAAAAVTAVSDELPAEPSPEWLASVWDLINQDEAVSVADPALQLDLTLKEHQERALANQKCLPPYQEYVAIGDSFTSGPWITPQLDIPCWRSGRNYPHILQSAIQAANFNDTSCSAANSTHIFTSQEDMRVKHAPQVLSLTNSTDLLTVGMGGNNNRIYMRTVLGCLIVSLVAPPTEASPCSSFLSDAVNQSLADGRETLLHDLSHLAEVVPAGATKILVGYPRIAPVSGHCFQLPLREPDIPWVYEVENRIEAMLSDIAEQTGFDYVSTLPSTDDHALCTKNPWLDGTAIVTTTGPKFPFHPLVESMQYLAGAIYDHLSDTYGDAKYCQ